MNIASAIHAFGQGLGLNDLALDANGLVSLELSEDDSLHLEQAQDDLLVYRVLNTSHISAPSMLASLKACDQRLHMNGWMPQIGMIGQGGQAQLVVLYRLNSEHVSEQGIEQALEALEQFKQKTIDPLGR